MVLATRNSPTAPRGRWIPWIFVAGMLTVVAVNAVMVYCAVSSWSGVATTHAFERGIAYNRLLAAAAGEAALGWQADVDYRADTDRPAALTITLHDAEGRPLNGAALSVEVLRPLEAQAPISIAMRDAGGGRYAGALDDLRAGQWDVRMTVARAGVQAHFTRRMVVQ
jgi:nitrogen fixation protein FixH